MKNMVDNGLLKEAKKIALKKYTYYESGYGDMSDDGEKRLEYNKYEGFMDGAKWTLENCKKNLTKEEIINELYNSSNIMSWDRIEICNRLEKEVGHNNYASIRQFIIDEGIENVLDVIDERYHDLLMLYHVEH